MYWIYFLQLSWAMSTFIVDHVVLFLIWWRVINHEWMKVCFTFSTMQNDTILSETKGPYIFWLSDTFASSKLFLALTAEFFWYKMCQNFISHFSIFWFKSSFDSELNVERQMCYGIVQEFATFTVNRAISAHLSTKLNMSRAAKPATSAIIHWWPVDHLVCWRGAFLANRHGIIKYLMIYFFTFIAIFAF